MMNSHILTLRSSWWQGILKLERIEERFRLTTSEAKKASLLIEKEVQERWNRDIDDLVRVEVDRYPALVNKLTLRPQDIHS